MNMFSNNYFKMDLIVLSKDKLLVCYKSLYIKEKDRKKILPDDY